MGAAPGVRAALGLFYGLALLALFLPLALTALMSFDASALVGFPIPGLTTRWYRAAIGDAPMLRAAGLSAAIAAGSALLAVVAGVWISLAARQIVRPGLRLVLLCGALIPLVTPGIVSAISLRMFIRALGIDPGAPAMMLGHVVHAVPYVVIMVSTRLASLPPDLSDAARDLGADAMRVLLRVTLPALGPTLAGAGCLAALLSFDDFLRSFFLGGYSPTLPVLLYGRLRSGLTPEIDAAATLVLIATGILGFTAERALRRQPRDASRTD